jgi:molybdenum cofactor cytidylyltransferase
MQNDQNTGVIILAAGHSSRMGLPKAFLPFSAQHTFIEQIITIYKNAGIQKIVLVIQPKQKKRFENLNMAMPNNLYLVYNNKPNNGRLYSILLGLQNLGSMPVFIQNIDNPFITVELINKLKQKLSAESYVSPQFKGKGGHPVLLSEELVNKLLGIELNFETKLSDVLKNYKKIELEIENPQFLTNINTREQYDELFKAF